MVDIGKVRKTQLNGNELEFEEELGKDEFLHAAGIAFEGLPEYLLEKVGGIIKCKVPSWSMAPNFVDDVLTFAEYFNGTVQTTINRLLRGDFTYVNDNLTIEIWKIYDNTDGTTILRTITYNHSYDSNDQLISSEVSEA